MGHHSPRRHKYIGIATRRICGTTGARGLCRSPLIPPVEVSANEERVYRTRHAASGYPAIASLLRGDLRWPRPAQPLLGERLGVRSGDCRRARGGQIAAGGPVRTFLIVALLGGRGGQARVTTARAAGVQAECLARRVGG